MTKAKRLQDWILQHPRVNPTLSECVLFLDELNKPELDPQHREILQSLMDTKGSITKVDDNWWWLHRDEKGVITNSAVNVLTKAMIDLGLLRSMPATKSSGMNRYTEATNTGIEALKQ